MLKTGIAQLLEQVKAVHSTLVVLEAPDGYEIQATEALVAAQLPVLIVNPRHVRDFAKATGTLAKTDALDAQTLAHFAEVIQPAVVTRRRQLVDVLTAVKNRLRQASTRIRPKLNAQSRGSNSDPGGRHGLGRGHSAETPLARERRVASEHAGCWSGPRHHVARDRLRVGTLTHKQIAALVRVAPFSRDSGMFRGKRTIWGGRAQAPAVLYMGRSWPPGSIPSFAFYRRLCQAGKAKKLALTACMQKLLVILNAMLKHRTPWHPAVETAGTGA